MNFSEPLRTHANNSEHRRRPENPPITFTNLSELLKRHDKASDRLKTSKKRQNLQSCRERPRTFWIFRTTTNLWKRFRTSENVTKRFKRFRNISKPFKAHQGASAPPKTSENVSELLGTFQNYSEPMWMLKTLQKTQERQRVPENTTKPLGTFHNYSELMTTYQNASEHP